ncbi:MAG: FtsW/RodA/SpoVE family cell cycle protein, partial [Delftia sp.]|nr:FtsW/RodA/SpoVE family cell cycle protein [Delftia sp.]
MRSEQVTGTWQAASGKRALASMGRADSTNGRERLLLALAGLFVLLGTLTLALLDLEHWSPVHWALVIVWSACFGAAHLGLCRHAPGRDPLLLPLAGLLTGWGLLLIARLADVAFLLRQSVWLTISVAAFILITARPPGLRWLRRYRYTWLLSGLALLAATLILGANPSGYGPRLWLGRRLPTLGNVYVQPSEILKLLMVAYLASYLAERRELVLDGPWLGRVRLPAPPYLAPLLAMWGLAMVLLAWQQDLGAALLFFLTFLIMLYLASGQWGYVVAGMVLFLIAAAGAYLFYDTVALRVDIWLDPWADPDGRAFQVVQALIALASGGLVGQGLG